LGILANPAGNSEGFDKKMENPNGRGVYGYGNPRAWGDNAFWKFPRQGGVKIWKLSVVWYGYFLELPITKILWNLVLTKFMRKFMTKHSN